jgi:hypothetical protein
MRRAREAASALCAAWALVAWAWALLHLAVGFAAALREERDLAAEARMLLASELCSLPRSHPMSGVLVRCDEARAARARVPAAAAAERVLGQALAAAAGAARRELSNLALFGGGAAAGLVLVARWAVARVAADSWAEARRRERSSVSAMRREKQGIAVPMYYAEETPALPWEKED